MQPSKTINVPQRDYELLTPSDLAKRLETRGINFCTTFIGINKEKKLAFMCHLDLPTTSNAPGEIAALLAEKHGGTAGFELSGLSMFPPRYRAVLISIFAVMAIATCGVLYGTPLALFIAWFIGWAQYRCVRVAKKAFDAPIVWRSPKEGWNILRSMGAAVDVDKDQAVEVWRDEGGVDLKPWRHSPCQLKAKRVRSK